MFNFLKYYLKPRYVIMKGISIEDRAIMFIGAHPKFEKNNIGQRLVTFKNRRNKYYASNIYKRIWTLKSLIKWRRLIGKNNKCIVRKNFKHYRA